MFDIRALASSLFLLCPLGCESPPTELPGPSASVFREQVYPLLLRDCGFVNCHGDDDRFFVLYGPGRTRLDASMDVFDPPTEDELWFSYQSARGMLTHDRDVFDSPLLSKPFEGRGHQGLDHFGRNVWQADDPAWRTIVPWALEATP